MIDLICYRVDDEDVEDEEGMQSGFESHSHHTRWKGIISQERSTSIYLHIT